MVKLLVRKYITGGGYEDFEFKYWNADEAEDKFHNLCYKYEVLPYGVWKVNIFWNGELLHSVVD